MRPCGGKRCTEEEEALLHFIIIYNLASSHYPIQPLSFSFPNFLTVWEWHKRSLHVNTQLQRESAINTIQ